MHEKIEKIDTNIDQTINEKCDDLGPFHIYTVFQKTSTFLFFNNCHNNRLL